MLRYSKVSEIFNLAKDIVEEFEQKKVPVNIERSGFVDDARWKELHQGKVEDRWDTAHVVTNDGEYVVAYKERAFEKYKKKFDPLDFRIFLLETTIHEFLYILDYRDAEEVDRRTKEILRKAMNIGVEHS